MGKRFAVVAIVVAAFMSLGVTRHVPPSNDAGVVLTTLAEMDACVEQVATRRHCVFGPEQIDVGAGNVFKLPYVGAANQEQLVIECRGTSFHSTETITEEAVVVFDFTEITHDHEIVIQGCTFNGSAGDEDETVVQFTWDTPLDPGHTGNNAGRLFLDNIHVGNLYTNTGTSTAVLFEGEKGGDHINLTRSFVESDGPLLIMDFDGLLGNRRFYVSDSHFTGDSQKASCLEIEGGAGGSPAYGGLASFSGVTFIACTHLKITLPNLAMKNVLLSELGATGWNPMIEHHGSFISANVSVTTYQTNAATGSRGPVYEASGDGADPPLVTAMNVLLDVVSRGWLFTEFRRGFGWTGRIMDVEALVTAPAGSVQTRASGGTTGSACWAEPFGPNMLADTLTTFTGSAEHCGTRRTTLKGSTFLQTYVDDRERTSKTQAASPYAILTNADGVFGKPFDNAGATGTVEFDLPAGSTEYRVMVYVTAAFQVDLDPQVGENIQGLANGVCLTNAGTIGEYVALEYDGNEWLIVEQFGTWGNGGACT